MRKRIFAMFLALFAALGMTACGKEKVETREVEYDMTFENRTGSDVDKLQIRYADNADWMDISLQDGTWESGYRIPVSMAGQMPVAENGWQVQMQFVGGKDAVIWEGVEFADAEVIIFSLGEDGEPEAEIGMDDGEEDILLEIDEPDDMTEEDLSEDGYGNADDITEE